MCSCNSGYKGMNNPDSRIVVPTNKYDIGFKYYSNRFVEPSCNTVVVKEGFDCYRTKWQDNQCYDKCCSIVKWYR